MWDKVYLASVQFAPSLPRRVVVVFCLVPPLFICDLGCKHLSVIIIQKGLFGLFLECIWDFLKSTNQVLR